MKRNFKIWLLFIISIVFIIIISFISTGLIGYLAYRAGYLFDERPQPWQPLIGLLLSGGLLSTVLTSFISRRLFIPIERLIYALEQVAAGNFSIQLREKHKFREIRLMSINFNNMVKQLNSTETLRSDFITNVSHEFKTPIASIEGYAALLLEPDLSEQDRKSYAQNILDSTKQLSSLTTNVLKLSNLETQEYKPELIMFSLDEQLRQAILTLEHRWSAKNLQLEMDLPPINYTGNEKLLFQVWINIFSNAIKFTPDGGTITTTITPTKNNILIAISDTGIGIPEETIKHIFDKFYQGDHNRNVEGNGLGLTLAQKIISLHHGEISARNNPDRGATFEISLPT